MLTAGPGSGRGLSRGRTVTVVWHGRATEAPRALWVEGESVWDAEPASLGGCQLARIDGEYIWQVDARGRDAGLLGVVRRGGEVVGPDRRTTVGYVEAGQAVVLRSFGRTVVGTTEPPDEAAAAAGLLLSYARGPDATESVSGADVAAWAVAAASTLWRGRGQQAVVKRYQGRYDEMERLLADGRTEDTEAAARALRLDLEEDRKSRRSAPQITELLTCRAALVELSSAPRIDPSLAADIKARLARIDNPGLETEVLKLRAHLAIATGRIDDASAALSRLIEAHPAEPAYRETATRLVDLSEKRLKAAEERSQQLLTAVRSGIDEARDAADRLSGLAKYAQELEGEFRAMFGDGQQLTFPRQELVARLETAEALHGRVRSLVEETARLRQELGSGHIFDAARRLEAPIGALDRTLARIVDTMRRGVSGHDA